jgi:hypothetical protein
MNLNKLLLLAFDIVQMEEAYQEWLDLGKPKGYSCYLLIYDRIFYLFNIMTKSKNQGVFSTFAL